MKITVEWLKEFVETAATPVEIGNELTMLGLELEAIEDSALGPVLDFKVTPNRGDCLSVFGLARELAAKDSQRYRPTEHFRRAVAGFGQTSRTSQTAVVDIEAPNLCPRYVGAILRGVKVGSSPATISQRLTACGMRPIDSIVDTTNYVMLELGQPLHAFDLRQLKGGRIVVRTARPGETMKTLDGQERKLSPEMLMICDAERPVAIAGVMGGENSEVASDTAEILLESAHFDPVSVRRTRRSLGMSTEASYRFERFVDPELCLAAARRVAELLGSDLSDVSDVYPGKAARTAVLVRESRWNRLMGIEIPRAAAATILVGLGCVVSETEDGLSVVPPTWRNDLQIEEDLVEEIGRMWGYEKIPEALPFGASVSASYGPEAAFRKRLRSAMLRLGFTETLTHTLIAPSQLSVEDPIAIRNPAAPELGLLRSSLLPGLVEAVAKNRGRSLAFFEIGRVFTPVERRSLAMLWWGQLDPVHWSGDKPANVDFFALKGALEALGSLIRRPLSFGATDSPKFQQGRRAAIIAGGEEIGVFGELDPGISESLDLPAETFAAEIDVDALMATPEDQADYGKLSPYPPVRRDFAFVIDKNVPYAALANAIRNAAEGLAEDVRLFDVYAGKGIEPGKHSLAIALTLRHADRTLTDAEANAISDRAFAEIKRLGGKQRA